jgi:general secretion pathway protein L
MTVVARVREEFSAWIASVAEAIVAGSSRFGAQQQVRLVETEQNTFVMSMTAKPKQPVPPECRFVLADDRPDQALAAEWKAALKGSRLDVKLRSSRFLFRPLDLPKRAADFLDGMIRSQIDRLTPWAASDAVFSWSAPVETAADRIHLTVIATPKAKVTPFVSLAEAWGAGSVALYASQDGESATADEIKVFEKHMRGSLDVVRVRRILSIVLLAAAIAAALFFVAADVIGGRLESEQQQLSRRITERRALMRLSSGSSDSAQTILARRKQNTPSSVLVLEALSEILPDSTYVTELRIEKDKLQIVGITQDAPSLVKMIEQSPHFTRATFFAPTTRSANDPGERFHVEARLKPYFGPAT